MTARALPDWHYDEISAEFRAGRAAMVCDWPGSYHLYRDPSTCVDAAEVVLSKLPAGPAGAVRRMLDATRSRFPGRAESSGGRDAAAASDLV